MSEGQFVWYELMTTDKEAAARFYGSVVGWSAEAYADGNYHLLKMGPAARAGLMTIPPALQERGVPPHWVGYIEVADVAAAVARAEAAGAMLRHGPDSIPLVGLFAVLTDPDGAPFYLYKPEQPEHAPAPMDAGSVGWRELQTPSLERGFGFYAGQFGWAHQRDFDMGPMGPYRIFGYGGLDQGGMMGVPAERASWLFYFVVDGIDAAAERVGAQGGTVLHGPQEVPGGAWTLNCRDPQGVSFALVSPTR